MWTVYLVHICKCATPSNFVSLYFANFFHQFCSFQELFIQDLVKEACVFTAQGKRKTVQKKDLGKNIVFGTPNRDNFKLPLKAREWFCNIVFVRYTHLIFWSSCMNLTELSIYINHGGFSYTSLLWCIWLGIQVYFWEFGGALQMTNM